VCGLLINYTPLINFGYSTYQVDWGISCRTVAPAHLNLETELLGFVNLLPASFEIFLLSQLICQ